MQTFHTFSELIETVVKPLNEKSSIEVTPVALNEIEKGWSVEESRKEIHSKFGFFSIVYRICKVVTPWLTLEWGQPMIEQEGGYIGLIVDPNGSLLLQLVPEPGNASRGIAGGPFMLSATVTASAGRQRKAAAEGKTLPFLGSSASQRAIEIPAPGDGGREFKLNTIFIQEMTHAEIDAEIEKFPAAQREAYALVTRDVALETLRLGVGSLHLRDVLAAMHLYDNLKRVPYSSFKE